MNADELRAELEQEGSIFTTTSDTEVFLHLMARSRAESVVEALRDALGRVRGAYSIVLLAGEKVLAARDPQGFRPLDDRAASATPGSSRPRPAPST